MWYYLKRREEDAPVTKRLMHLFKPNVLVACVFLAASTASAATLFVNGDFDSGNTGFTSGYSFVAYAPSNCMPEGVYTIGPSPQSCHPAWPSSYGAPPGASANTMIVNGATLAGVSIWSETVTVLTNTDYYFSVWVASNYANPAVLSFSINGTQIGNNITASSTLGLWTQFYAPWNSGSNTTAVASLLNQNIVASGNDFSLDLFAFDTVAPTGATSSTPEPATRILLGGGLILLSLLQRYRKRAREYAPSVPSERLSSHNNK